MIKGIRYYSFFGSSGYGDAAVSYISSLNRSGIPIRWSPLVDTRWGYAPWGLLPDELKPGVKEISESMQEGINLVRCLKSNIEYDTVFLHTIPELWPKLIERDKVNIGYTVWETDQLPQKWPELILGVDHLCVPCRFNKDLFTIKNGPEVSVVPHAIRTRSNKTSAQACKEFKLEHGITEGMYSFYTISTWQPRKAMYETLHAYLLEFDANDDVCLIVKTDEIGDVLSSDGARRPVRRIVKDLVSNYANPAKVIVIAERVAEEKVQLIHEIGDCFFSLTHSEGWGLGAFDAAIAGNSVIITGWGGQLDYLPEEYSYHVKFDLKPVQEVKRWESYSKSQNWAYADISDACRKLRYVFDHQQEAEEKAGCLQSFVQNNFSRKQVNSILLDAIYAAHK